MKPNLTHCRFCGNTKPAIFWQNYPNGTYYHIGCLCGAEGPYKTSKEEAENWWNKPHQYLIEIEDFCDPTS